MSSVETRVSFVVPTKNAARTLGACLQSIREQDLEDVEIVVVDNFSTDATPAIGRELADVFDSCGPERSAQRNRGARLAAGSVLIFADADMVFERGVAREALARLGPSGDLSVSALVIPERAFGAGFWARCRVLEKELYLGDTAVEAARAFRASDFFEVGGYDERYTGPEDWDLADRITAIGGRLARTRAHVWHDEGHIELRAAFRKKRYYGRGVAAYLRAPDRRRLPRRVLSQPRELVRRPVLSAGLAVLKTVELSGIAAGVADARRAETRGVAI
jgi:glycosyltransferase involved in cell wall biosynthesis